MATVMGDFERGCGPGSCLADPAASSGVITSTLDTAIIKNKPVYDIAHCGIT